MLFALALAALPAYLAGTPTDGETSPEPRLGAAASAVTAWETRATSDGSRATRRHEAGGVVVGDALYLLGGRGRPPLERWSAADGGWTDLGPAPLELHHFQPVAIDGRIHVVGAFTCCYPNEAAVAEIHVYDTASGTWDVAGSMPPERVRGSAAAVTHDGRLYVLGGNTRGHDGGAVPWFDVWDPASGAWRVLPDAPHARDHFAAVVVDGRLVAAAGRRSTLPNPAANPVTATDVYDFRSGAWRTADPIPSPRAGTVGLAVGGEAIVIGGELNTEPRALDAVEAFDVAAGTWRALPPLVAGRHGSGGGVLDGALHVAAGATSLGGRTETDAHETLSLDAVRADAAGDGEDRGDGGSDDGGTAGGAGTPDGSSGDPSGGSDGGPIDRGSADEPGENGADGGTDDATGGTVGQPPRTSSEDGSSGRRGGAGGGLGGGWSLTLALLAACGPRALRTRSSRCGRRTA